MPVILTSLFSLIGTVATGLFGFKGDQAKTVQAAIETVKNIDNNDSATIAAQANAISLILTQGSWLERQWRPLLMILLMGLIGCWFFDLIPPNFNEPISPMMQQIIDLLKIGVMGYVPCRSLEKIVTSMQLGGILKQLIAKKIA